MSCSAVKAPNALRMRIEAQVLSVMRTGSLQLRRTRCGRRDARDHFFGSDFAVVALAPLGEDAVAVLGGPREVVLDQPLLVVGRARWPAAAATPGCATIAKFLPYSIIASLLDAQSASFFAASSFLVPLMMPIASRSQPRPSFGNTRSIGAPLAFLRVGAVLERDADHVLAGGRPCCTAWSPSACTARCSRAARPCTSSRALAVVAPQLQPGGDVEVAGARRRRVAASRSGPCRPAWSGPSRSRASGCPSSAPRPC